MNENDCPHCELSSETSTITVPRNGPPIVTVLYGPSEEMSTDAPTPVAAGAGSDANSAPSSVAPISMSGAPPPL